MVYLGISCLIINQFLILSLSVVLEDSKASSLCALSNDEIIEVKDYIDYQKVLTHITKKSDQYNNIVPLYLSDPLAEKKDISWFVKKEI